MDEKRPQPDEGLVCEERVEADEQASVEASTPEQPSQVEATDDPSPASAEVASVDEQASIVEELTARVEELAARIAALEEENAQLRDSCLQAQTDYQNYRRRAERESAQARDNGKEEAVLAILPVLDNLERSLETMNPEATDLAAVVEGVGLVLRQFSDNLERLSVSPIPGEGTAFDPALHEAVARVETEEAEEGTVIQEAQRGYRLGDRVLRPARVVVAVKPQTADG